MKCSYYDYGNKYLNTYITWHILLTYMQKLMSYWNIIYGYYIGIFNYINDVQY